MYSNAYRSSLKSLGFNRSLKINYCTIIPCIRNFNIQVDIPHVELLNNEFNNVHPVTVYSNIIDEIKSSINNGEEFYKEYDHIAYLSYDEFLRLFEIYIYDDYIDNNNKKLLLEGFLFEYNMYNKLIIKINNLIIKYDKIINNNLKEKDLDLFMVSLSNYVVNSYIENPETMYLDFWENVVRKSTGNENSLYALIKGKIFDAHAVTHILNNLVKFQFFREQYMNVVISSLYDECIYFLLDKIPSLSGTGILKEIKSG